ncbi:MAG: biopolymer transporter ExbD [Verrucomicrobiota bacterium]
MARSFHRKRSLEAQSELNVTALIDLGFALLIIFMISTPLIENKQSMPIDLPTGQPSSTQAPPESVNLVVLDEGYRLNDLEIGDADLDRELERFAMQSKPPVISISMDRDTVAQRFVSALDLLKKHKLSRIHINTKVEE